MVSRQRQDVYKRQLLRLVGRLLCVCLVVRVFLGVFAPLPPFFGCLEVVLWSEFWAGVLGL